MEHREELDLRIAQLLSELSDEQFNIFLVLLPAQMQCDDNKSITPTRKNVKKKISVFLQNR